MTKILDGTRGSFLVMLSSESLVRSCVGLFFFLKCPMRQMTDLSLLWKEILDKVELEQHKRSSCFCSLVFPRR